jgi:hypothetical protein
VSAGIANTGSASAKPSIFEKLAIQFELTRGTMGTIPATVETENTRSYREGVWLTSQSLANQSRPLTSLLTGKIQGIFSKTGLGRQVMSPLFPAKSGRWAANSLLGETGNSLSQIRENSGPIREACRGFSELAANGPSSVRRPRRRQARPRETAPVAAGQMSSSSDPARSRASSVVAWPRLWLSV